MMKFLFKLAITGTILYLLFRRIDAERLSQALSQASYGLFALALFSLFIILILPAVSQKILFKSCRLDLKTTSIYDINLKSMFYSLVVPGDVAAGLVRFIRFSRAHRGRRVSDGEIKQSVIVVMAVDRFLNMAALILPLAPLLFLAPLPDKTIWFQKTALLISAVFLLLFFFGYRMPFANIIGKLPSRWEKPKKLLLGLFGFFQNIPKIRILFSFFIAFVFQMGTIAIIDILLAKSTGIEIPWFAFISIAATIRFIRYIPVTLSGIGVREGLFPFFLHFFGISFEKALTLGALGTTLVILIGAMGGILEFIEIYFKKR